MAFIKKRVSLHAMKKIVSITFVFFLLSSIISCTTDFDIASDWKEITIVYGLIDQSAPNNYIKINRAFLSEDVSALDLAQIPDSIYYGDNMTAKIEEVSQAGTVIKEIPLTKVNVEEEGFVKEEGVFANSPNFLYKTDYVFQGTNTYRLVINTPTGNMVTAETPIIEDFRVRSPDSEDVLNLLFDTKVRWSSAEYGAIYDLIVHFNYSEYRVEGTELVRSIERLSWPLASNFKPGVTTSTSLITYNISSEAFFEFLATRLTAEDQIDYREFESMDFEFFVGSEELKAYNEVQLAQFGITSSQVTPEYTNVENGLGLFTTRYNKVVDRVYLNGATLDEIACGEITGHLKFAPQPGSPNYPRCF